MTSRAGTVAAIGRGAVAYALLISEPSLDFQSLIAHDPIASFYTHRSYMSSTFSRVLRSLQLPRTIVEDDVEQDVELVQVMTFKVPFLLVDGIGSHLSALDRSRRTAR